MLTKKKVITRVKLMLRKSNKTIILNSEKLLNSGAIEISDYEDNFLLSKIILTACFKSEVNQQLNIAFNDNIDYIEIDVANIVVSYKTSYKYEFNASELEKEIMDDKVSCIFYSKGYKHQNNSYSDYEITYIDKEQIKFKVYYGIQGIESFVEEFILNRETKRIENYN